MLNAYTEKKVDCLCCVTASRRFGARDAGWKYPVDGVWKRWWPVTAQALAKVDVIRDQALALGWSQAQPHYYLCLRPQQSPLYFYNPDVNQPWLKTTAPGA